MSSSPASPQRAAPLRIFRQLLGRLLGRCWWPWSKAGAPRPARPPLPERPANWNRTYDDLWAEVKAGQRQSISQPELEWARQYERSLIPPGTRFPRQGDLYESKQDQSIEYLTAWQAPFTGGGTALLHQGEQIWIDTDPGEERPLGSYALPVEYDALEARMVPAEDRQSPKYGGFYFYFKTLELNSNFILVQTGFRGKRQPRR